MWCIVMCHSNQMLMHPLENRQADEDCALLIQTLSLQFAQDFLCHKPICSDVTCQPKCWSMPKHAPCRLPQLIGTTIIYWMISLCNENMRNARWPGNQPSARIGSQCCHARASENLRIGIHIDIHFDFQPWQAKLSNMCEKCNILVLFNGVTCWQQIAGKNWKVHSWIHICGIISYL